MFEAERLEQGQGPVIGDGICAAVLFNYEVCFLSTSACLGLSSFPLASFHLPYRIFQRPLPYRIFQRPLLGLVLRHWHLFLCVSNLCHLALVSLLLSSNLSPTGY